MITGGHNLGRVGVITSRERHPGSFDIVHVKDAANNTFATRYDFLFQGKKTFCLFSSFNRLSYVFLIGKGVKPWISLPADKGVKKTIAEEREKKIARKAN